MKKITKKLKKIAKNTKKNPEDVLFLFLFLCSVGFVILCFGNLKRDFSAEPLMVVVPKNTSPFERRIKKMVNGYPIERMTPQIAKKNKKVAAYLVAIAKKESNWGVHSPQKNGKDCYNYWGYRGSYNPTSSGYSCFDSPAQAVNIVGKRINNLVAKKIDTPRKMVVWKCGNSGAGRRTGSAAKWIRDVGYYYEIIM